MIEGLCHCGRVGWTVKGELERAWLTRCNCSYCRRSGALWNYAPADAVTLGYAIGDVIRYVHGDRTLAIVTCVNCGCTTHWESLDTGTLPRVGLNMLMASPQVTDRLPVRHFDGADSWEFLD